MNYNNHKILKIVLNSKKDIDKNSLFYDETDNLFCSNFWCYQITKNKIKLSELIPKYVPDLENIIYKKITNEIKEFGFDYSKGYIVIHKNKIIDGNHRYFILKKLYGLDHEIIVLKILNNFNPLLHMIFIFFFIKPIKITYHFLKSIGVIAQTGRARV